MKLKIKDKMKRQATHREEIFAKQIFDGGLISRIRTDLLPLNRKLTPPNGQKTGTHMMARTL